MEKIAEEKASGRMAKRNPLRARARTVHMEKLVLDVENEKAAYHKTFASFVVRRDTGDVCAQ